MKAEERQMIYEINHARNSPKDYLKYILPFLEEAKRNRQDYGKGDSNYSLTYTTSLMDGVTKKTIDTTWHYRYEEELKAMNSLVDYMRSMEPASILKPDAGIYKATRLFADDQNAHHWTLLHTGSDGSHPWDRIKKHSPQMISGNENLAGRYPTATAREIVIQLLIDSGIPGYGHRYNLLNAQWTHVACFCAGKQDGMIQWIQNFGKHR